MVVQPIVTEVDFFFNCLFSRDLRTREAPKGGAVDEGGVGRGGEVRISGGPNWQIAANGCLSCPIVPRDGRATI